MFRYMIAAGLLVISALVSAAPPKPGEVLAFPAYYPAAFEGMGTLQKVLRTSRMVQINATRYVLQTGVQISTLEYENGTLFLLKPGMDVGFLLSDKKVDGKRVITAIYELPAGSVPKH